MGRTLVVLETGVYVSLSLQRSLYFRIDLSIKFQKPGKVFSPLPLPNVQRLVTYLWCLPDQLLAWDLNILINSKVTRVHL
jgi:hypothetical protein